MSDTTPSAAPVSETVSPEIRELVDELRIAAIRWGAVQDVFDRRGLDCDIGERSPRLTEAERALLARIAQAEEDSRRLDWLEEAQSCVVTIGGRDHYLADTTSTIRAAIDASRLTPESE